MNIFDYATLRIIWWGMIGLLLIIYAITDGFDLGIGMILHRVARTEDERRIVINSIGPIWEGNQVWLIFLGGAIFAAWPMLYALIFSGFYFAMLAVLFALILRPVGFKYRGKINNPTWRSLWDACLFISGFVPALIFGIALGNVLQGIAFHFDDLLRVYFDFSFIDLLNPFALLCGFISVSMLISHGGNFLALKTEDKIQQRANQYSRFSSILYIILFISAGIYIINKINGYTLTSVIDPIAPSNPLHKTVTSQIGAWLNNYKTYPLLWIIPFFALFSAINSIWLSALNHHKLAWLSSAICITGTIATFGASMFPFILPSSSHPNMSLIIWDTSASQKSLSILLFACVIFLPLIIAYTSWVYYVMRGKVTKQYIAKNKAQLY